MRSLFGYLLAFAVIGAILIPGAQPTDTSSTAETTTGSTAETTTGSTAETTTGSTAETTTGSTGAATTGSTGAATTGSAGTETTGTGTTAAATTGTGTAGTETTGTGTAGTETTGTGTAGTETTGTGTAGTETTGTGTAGTETTGTGTAGTGTAGTETTGTGTAGTGTTEPATGTGATGETGGTGSTAPPGGDENTLCPWNDGITDNMRYKMLAKHNALRGDVAMGVVCYKNNGTACLRKANQMPQLTYSCELETRALCRAKLCDKIGAAPDDVCENYAAATSSTRGTDLAVIGTKNIQKWFSEITALTTPIDQIQNLWYDHLGISSFAKMCSDKTTKVGCAVVECGSQANVVCHYKTTLTEASKLYNCGPTCNKCEGGKASCVNGLCPATTSEGQC